MTARVRGGLDGIVEALAWSDEAALSRRLDDEFVATVSDRVAAAAPADVMAGLEALPAASRLRLLRAPEVTRRVLFAHSPPPDAISCLRQAVAVEAAIAAGGRGPAGGWSALGDVWFEPDGILGRWPTLGEGAVPLDYGSPWVTRIDLTGREEFADRERLRPGPDTVSAVHHRITAAWWGLAALDPTIVDFVRASTTVIVLQAHDDSPHQVSSGTNGIYVGRTFITNAHADGASVEALAEAIVHESIHGCLQRDVLHRPFTGALDDGPAIASPWTGRPLPVRAFVEASFVWFGLVQLWARATGGEVFDAGESRRLLLRAVRGFLAGPLVGRLSPWRDDVRPDLFELLDAMQDVVVAAVGARSVRVMFSEGTHRSVSPAVTAARTRARLGEFGITRVADLTGLDRVGIPVMAAYRPAATSLVVSMGKGLTADAAYASATMESIELWHAERPSIELISGSVRQLRPERDMVDWRPLPRDHRLAFDDDTETAWVTARSLVGGAEALVPYGVVHTDDDAIFRGDGGHFLCTSNGLASGNDRVEAQIHGVCELIERDATTRWRLAGQPLDTVVTAESVTDPAGRELLTRFDDAGLAVVIDDITSDVRVATMHVTVFESGGDPGSLVHATAGMGTHPSRDVALSRALTEAAQSRLALISGARDDLFRDRYETRADARSLHDALAERARVAGVSTRSLTDAPDAGHRSLEEERGWVLATLAEVGLAAWWVDLIEGDRGLAVGRAIVPGLEMLNDIAGFTPGPRALAALAPPRRMVAAR